MARITQSYEATAVLLDHGANTEASAPADITEATGLTLACIFGYQNTVELLVSRGAKVDALSTEEVTSSSGKVTTCTSTGLHRACKSGYEKIVELLVDGGADVNARDHVGNTPLHVAVCFKTESSSRIITYLISKGADPDAENSNKESVLGQADRYSNRPAVKTLRKASKKFASRHLFW